MTIVTVGSQVIQIEGSAKEASDAFKDRIAQPLADDLLPRAISVKGNQLLKTAVHEFLKNILHGQYGMVEIYRLPDGSVEIITDDIIGEDQLDPAMCGHLGNALIIDPIVGSHNHHETLARGHYHSWIHLDPSIILAAV